MSLRADHVAGVFFIGVGLLVIALSGDLPTGTLSMPGSGFLPKIVAVLTIFFGLVLALRAGESRPFAAVPWADAKHAAMVVGITAVAVALFGMARLPHHKHIADFRAARGHRTTPAAAGNGL